MTSTNIIINERATIQSIGEHTNGNCEPVVCLTEDKIFNSVTDTANHYDASISQISAVCNKKAKTCHKMRFCFLRDIDQHLDEIMENNRRNTEKISDLERKAALWDAYQKEQEEARKAEEERQQAIAKVKAKIERRERIRHNAYQKYLMAEGRLAEAERELKDLEGGESK